MDLVKTAKDSTYVAVGFGVQGLNKAQIRKDEFMGKVGGHTTAIGDNAMAARAKVFEVYQTLETRLEPIFQGIDGYVLTAAALLPEPAGKIINSSRDVCLRAGEEIRARVWGVDVFGDVDTSDEADTAAVKKSAVKKKTAE